MMPEIIVALDTSDQWVAYDIWHALGNDVFYKVGLELYNTAAGPTFVGALLSAKCKVFLDLKLNDIPTTVENTVRVIVDRFPAIKFLSVRGSHAVGAALRATIGTGVRIAHVPVLSCDVETGVAVPTAAPVVVCRPSMVDQYRHAGHTVIAVGVRPPGHASDDHVEASEGAPTAHYVVIGRPITRQRPNYRAAYDLLVSDLNDGC